MKSKIISTTLVLVGFVIGASALSALAGVWTPPTQSPPNGNVDAPINVGDLGQVKTGSLTVGGLGVLGSFAFKPVGGTPPTSGQVLMADDSDLSNGKVKWGTLPAVGGGGGSPSQVIKSGAASLACSGYDTPGSVAVSFPAGSFTSVPNVTITPNWTNYSGDEAPSWWITNLTTSGFTIKVHTTSENNCEGSIGAAGRVYWVAVGN